MKILNRKCALINEEPVALDVKEILFPEQVEEVVEPTSVSCSVFDDEPFLINDAPVENNSNLDDSVGCANCMTPQMDESNIVASITDLIKSKQNAVSEYQGFLAYLASPEENSLCRIPGIVPIVKDILADESRHLGQLQQLLKSSTQMGKEISLGQQQAEEHIQNDVSNNADVLHPMFNAQEDAKFVPNSFKQLPVRTIHFQDSKMNCEGNACADEISGDDFCSVANIDDDF